MQSEPIRSTYRWQGQIERQDKIKLLLKTTRTAYPTLEKLLLELHPYEFPAIFAVQFSDTSIFSKQWVHSNCLQ